MEYDNEKTVVNSGWMRSPGAGPNPEYANLNVLPIGTRLSEFEIVDLIGEGGFGIVYLAYDHSLERHVALKEYMPSGLASRTRTMYVTVKSQHQADTFNTGLRSFINEARLLAQFDSPSLVKVYRFWEANGTAYMVMPYYDGITLKQALRERRINPTQEWIKAFLANLCDAIDTIHLAKCYHRDIAPDNILLLKDGRPLLLDFGAARRVISDRTQGPTAILKPGFAPIEQYADIPGLKQGPWTDVYALAAVVYYLITGKAPVPAVSRIVHDDMVPAREVGKGRFSDAFLAGVDRALAVRPEQRTQTIAELRSALNIDDSVSRTLPPPSGQPMQTPGSIGSGFTSSTSHWGPAGMRSSQQRTMPMGMSQRNYASEAMFADQRSITPEKTGSKLGWAVLGVVLCTAIAGGGYWGLRNILPDRLAAAPDNVSTPDVSTPDTSTPSPQAPVALQEQANPPSRTTEAPASPAPPVAEKTIKPPPPAIEQSTASANRANSGASGGTSASSSDMAGSRPTQLPADNAQRAQAAPALSPEDELWKMATSSNRASAYEAYLNDYPNGRHASAAKIRLNRLQPKSAPATPPAMSEAPSAAGGPGDAEKSGQRTTPKTAASSEDDETWRMASTLDNAPAYESYLSRYPNGRNASAARNKIASLNKQASLEISSSPSPSQQRQEGGSSTSKSETAPAKSSEPASTSAPVTVGTQAATSDRAQGDRAPGVHAPGNQEEKKAPSADNQVAYSKPLEPGTNVKPLPEPSPKPPPAQPSDRAPGQPAAQSASRPTRTVKLDNQTMTGDFSVDPTTGVVSGKGRIVWNNGDRFEGTLVHGVKEGEGEFIWANGQRYKGNWSRDQPNGTGTIQFANGNRYEGAVRDGVPNGSGTIHFTNGNRYVGEMRNGIPNGTGTIYFANGNRYKGEVKDGLQHGKGVNRFKNGDVYDGAWVNGRSNGQGRYTWASGSYWEGEFRDDRMTENGKLVYADNASSNASSGASASGGDSGNSERQAASANGNSKD